MSLTIRARRRLFSTGIAVCISIVIAMFNLVSCEKSPAQASEYEAYLDKAADIWHFQGAYLVAKGDSIVARGGRGDANIAQGRANTPETQFLLGSLTKSFTAIATLQLVEQGKIDLNHNLAEYIDVYPQADTNQITVHDLLSHRSGIPDVLRNPEFARRMNDTVTPIEIISYFRDMPLDFKPGTQYAYSSSNYVLLGLIIEAVSGEPWEEYVQAHICQPAGMTSTGVFFDYATNPDFATGYGTDRGGSLVPAPAVNPSLGYAAGSLASTVDDLYLLHKALYDTSLLSRQSVDLMLTPYSPAYGYGWIVDDFGGHRLTAHGGGAPGFVSMMQRWIDDSVCVIVLSNNVGTSAHTIANTLAAIALGESYQMPLVKHPIELDAESLSEFIGSYRLASGEIRRVFLRDGRLVVSRSSGPLAPILPEAPDRFYFAHDQMTTLTFLRDTTGKLTGQVLQQAFDQDTAWLAD